jgi:L-aminopeptidase/D-esterase-like protein
MKLKNAITDVPGILVGHAQDINALTGCTVILCEQGAVGGVDQRGGAPCTREVDALHPMHLVSKVHGVVLAGGSAFGLEAATGVMRYLEERDVGFDTRIAKVPIVPAAILFDLGIGKADVRPDAAMGYLACENASSEPPAEGNVGAGTGATVGKISVGSVCKSELALPAEIGAGVIVAAIVAVNAFGISSTRQWADYRRGTFKRCRTVAYWRTWVLCRHPSSHADPHRTHHFRFR